MKGVIYYTNNILDEKIFNGCLNQLKKVTEGMEIVSVSHKPVDFGKNIVVDLPSSPESILRQIYIGLENISSDLIYLVEHDVLYHPSHFENIPRRSIHYLYNQNIWQIDEIGQAIYRKTKRTSQLIVYRETLKNYLELVFKRIERRGYRVMMGVAPMTHQIDGINFSGLRGFDSEFPNIDIRHKDNLTKAYIPTKKDLISNEVFGWGKVKDIYDLYFC